MTADDETQAIADARETRDLVLAASLALAVEAIRFVEEHERLASASVRDEMEGGGFVWDLRAQYLRGHSFVRVQGTPETRGVTMVTPEQMAQIMGNQSASFDVNVPRSWVELAARAPEMDDAFFARAPATGREDVSS